MRNYEKDVYVSGNGFDRPIGLSVTLEGFDGSPDCQIGHFGYNFFYRTPYGINRLRYCTDKKMESAVKKVLTHKGFKVEYWK
jgi:hypothetical protein